MPKIIYINKKFHKTSMDIIYTANIIIDEYQEDGMDLTLRQLYYQFVSRGYIKNEQSEYKKLGNVINDARLTGYIDWKSIEDRTRNVIEMPRWKDPAHIIKAARNSYKTDHWKNQNYHVEVWIEKEALIGVISSICRELDIDYFACKGYISQSEMWSASQRIIDYYDSYNQKTIIIHLGDHDPSGIDMTRDIEERLNLFVDYYGVPFPLVKRIALNMDQINEYNPPPNPTKIADTRSGSYISKYGNESWELDALEPTVLRDLIEEEVLLYRDEEIYNANLKIENKHKKILKNIEENWEKL